MEGQAVRVRDSVFKVIPRNSAGADTSSLQWSTRLYTQVSLRSVVTRESSVWQTPGIN